MQKLLVVGVSAIALGAALGSIPVQAKPVGREIIGNIADYNAAEVKAAGDIVTVPEGLATYIVGTGTLEINSRFTVTLPTGFSFSSQPALNVPAPAQMVYQGGGIGAQSITYTVTGGPLSGGAQVALSTFAVQGATALESPIPVAAALPITMQSTNNSQVNNNDAKPLSAKAFASEPGVSSSFEGTLTFIDLSSPTLGTQFWPGSDTTTVAILDMGFGPQTSDFATGDVQVLSPDGLPNTLSTADTATITITGAFNGISAAFAATDASCATPIKGVAGTVAPSTLTFTGVPFETGTVVCLTANGTSLLQEDLKGFSATIAPGTSTDFLGTAVFAAFPGFVTYTGGGVINVSNFFTGDDAGYASLLRVNNAGNTPSNIFALVQPDTGGAALTGSLGSIGAGEGTVFTVAQVEAAVTGLDLANSGQRATLQLIISGNDFIDVKASTFLVNPGGIVDNVGVESGISRAFPPLPPPPPPCGDC